MVVDFLSIRTSNDAAQSFILETAAVACQSQGGTVAVIHDEERRFNASTLRGLAVERVQFFAPESPQQARVVLTDLVKAGNIDLVLISGFGTLFAIERFVTQIRALGEKTATSIVLLP